LFYLIFKVFRMKIGQALLAEVEVDILKIKNKNSNNYLLKIQHK